MLSDYHYDPMILSSSCPSSCALVKYALQMGATIDPEFLMHCHISDSNFQKKVDGLKSIPLIYETPSSFFDEQENLYLDMGIDDTSQFYDRWQFQEYNAWANTPEQWDSLSSPTEDLFIEFL